MKFNFRPIFGLSITISLRWSHKKFKKFLFGVIYRTSILLQLLCYDWPSSDSHFLFPLPFSQQHSILRLPSNFYDKQYGEMWTWLWIAIELKVKPKKFCVWDKDSFLFPSWLFPGIGYMIVKSMCLLVYLKFKFASWELQFTTH